MSTGNKPKTDCLCLGLSRIVYFMRQYCVCAIFHSEWLDDVHQLGSGYGVIEGQELICIVMTVIS